MSKLQLKESNKLQYGKYLYKLKLHSSLSNIFRTDLQRGGNLSFAKDKINQYYQLSKNGETVSRNVWGHEKFISTESLIDANEIYKILRRASDYLIRCESSTLIIYSNDKKLLLKIADKTTGTFPELWEPDPATINFLKNNSNVILVNTPPVFPYKISFGRKKGKPELAKWINANLDKSQAGDVLIKNLENSGWIQGQYIYVRDESIVFLVQMIAGDNITRIDKLVYRNNLDK